MKALGRTAAGAALALATVSLTACSKTVKWEEEVLLNNGQTVWITRTVKYALQGGGHNPLDLAYRPKATDTIDFSWQGKKYSYTDFSHPILLAISPRTNQPILVAPATTYGWYQEHNYRCTVPFYVQFVPDVDGQHWSWPPAIESWLYGLPANLMSFRPELNEQKNRYSREVIADLDYTLSANLKTIDSSFTFDHCIK